MGFRSAFVTEETYLWPTWIVEKWSDRINFPASGVLGCASSQEHLKCCMSWFDFLQDVQRWLRDDSADRPRSGKLVLVYLHDCGGLTRVEISATDIVAMDPTGYRLVDASNSGEHEEHDLCAFIDPRYPESLCAL